MVFFLVGLTIRLKSLIGAALNVRLNLLTQVFSLGLMPALGWGLAQILAAGGMNSALVDGVLVLVGAINVLIQRERKHHCRDLREVAGPVGGDFVFLARSCRISIWEFSCSDVVCQPMQHFPTLLLHVPLT